MNLQKERRSDLLIPPIGLRSALEQSYLVMYPRRDSSTLAEPSTSKDPTLPDGGRGRGGGWRKREGRREKEREKRGRGRKRKEERKIDWEGEDE